MGGVITLVPMKIEHNINGKKGEFVIDQDGNHIAELQYFHSAVNEINIHHTEVDDSLAGKGVGRDLVKAAVVFAREEKLKIVPTCSYAKHVIDKTPEYQDVLA